MWWKLRKNCDMIKMNLGAHATHGKKEEMFRRGFDDE
jgi:hypothetical protein